MQWYYRPWVVFFAILLFGPLGLLLLWFRPNTKLSLKIVITVLVMALTVWMVHGSFVVYGRMIDYYKELGELV
ncbi:MAG: hypothetical protein WBC00_04020 [Candidatus Omnitrophota bacterium]